MAAAKKRRPKAKPATKAPSEPSTEIVLYAQPVEQQEKRGRGRPGEYRIEYCTQVIQLCRLGATDAEMAAFFDVCEATLNNWKLAHPEFLESIREGKIMSDMRVANSLYKRATGYVVEMQKIIGSGDNARVLTYNMTVEPDVAACQQLLNNRRPQNWRNKRELEVTVMSHEQALEQLLAEIDDDERSGRAGGVVH